MALSPAVIDPVELAGRLRPVLLLLHRQLRRETLALGVSVGQVSVLAAVRDQPGIGAAELAAREGTSVPSICGHLDKLEAAGLLSRERATDTDRRRVGLTLTPAGQKVLRSVRSRRTAWLAEQLAGLDEQERGRIDSAVDALNQLVRRR